jgi:hypothetical protein
LILLIRFGDEQWWIQGAKVRCYWT